MKRFFALGFFLLGACVHTQEMPLALNMVRLDTHASGLLFAGQATSQTMKRAAEATLQRGYTHFRLDQVGMAQGSEVSGVYSTVNGSASGYTMGNTAYASGSASGFSTPIRRPTADVGVTVIMFHADEPGAKSAFDAGQVLRQQG
ncbi:hypothetical protein [Methylocystis parvus]|uniref:hypothetical protein n=1 Tax=Methylocystis parvus TaxID=134 RepID=UPI003C790E49